MTGGGGRPAVADPVMTVVLNAPGAAPAVASPVALIVATLVVAEFHVTADVTVTSVPSVIVSVSLNCTVLLTAMVGLVGVIWIETTVAGVTVKTTVFTVAVPSVAVMLVVPTVAPLARPPAGVMGATVGALEPQVTDVVIGFVVPSLYVPVATNWIVRPLATLAAAAMGVIAMDLSVAAVTVNVAVPVMVPVMVPEVAVMVAVPTATGVATPVVATIVAMLAALVLQATLVVMTAVELSLYVPVATKLLVEPSATLEADVVTAMEVSVLVAGGVTAAGEPSPPPQAASSAVKPSRADAVNVFKPIRKRRSARGRVK